MSPQTCPRCGAPQESVQPDPLARCEFCGALLAAEPGAEVLLDARPRLDPAKARRRVAAELRRSGAGGWGTREPSLALYPFFQDGGARRPYRPAAQLPPLIKAAWKPSGADLVFEGSDGEKSLLGEAARIPIAEASEGGESVVFYPFYRVPLVRGEEESAAWCDGVDGQVMLPVQLAQAAGVSGRKLAKLRLPAFAAGAGAGLLFPVPFSFIAAVAVGAAVWWKAPRW